MLEIGYRPLGDLVPYARNARTHSEAQVAQIAASIREFGWTNPVLVDEVGGIVAGHGRILAARQLGLEAVPCIELEGLSEAQKRAYVIADNKLALNAGWDEELLAIELDELKSLDFDLDLTGFDSLEVDETLARAGAAEGLMLGDGEAAPLAGGDWDGMPEFEHADKTAYQSIVVHLVDEDARRKLSGLLEKPLTEKTRFVWFPGQDIESYANKRYVSEKS